MLLDIVTWWLRMTMLIEVVHKACTSTNQKKHNYTCERNQFNAKDVDSNKRIITHLLKSNESKEVIGWRIINSHWISLRESNYIVNNQSAKKRSKSTCLPLLFRENSLSIPSYVEMNLLSNPNYVELNGSSIPNWGQLGSSQVGSRQVIKENL